MVAYMSCECTECRDIAEELTTPVTIAPKGGSSRDSMLCEGVVVHRGYVDETVPLTLLT